MMKLRVLTMVNHLKLCATQFKELTQTQTHPLHDLNANSDSLRNRNTFTLPSLHNVFVPKKKTKLPTPHLMSFIDHTNSTTSHEYKVDSAQSQQITTLAKVTYTK